tara:strand:+ start:699 stop:905 length:207 start_codon:yes stop_codon:yes gene_type:complete
MFCNKKVFSKFLLFSVILLITSVCCNAIFVSASTPKQETTSFDTKIDIQTQQRVIIGRLNRIESRLDR